MRLVVSAACDGVRPVGHLETMMTSALAGAATLAEAAEWENMIVEEWTTVVCDEDIQAGFYRSVLVGIVEQDYIYIGAALQQRGDASHSFLCHAHYQFGVFEVVLHGFVANAQRVGRFIGEDEALCAAFVAAAHSSDTVSVLQQADKVFYMGCFASATGGEIANGDNRRAEADRREQATIVHAVAPPNEQPINEGERVKQQP